MRNSALVYGDGDGRFLARLARAAPEMPVLAVDASAAMLHHAARRLPQPNRVRLVQADALSFSPAESPLASFGTIITHFFLDCFTEPDLARIAAHATRAASADAIWIVSDFAIPARGSMRPVAAAIVGALYLAFGLLTGLRTRRLPDYARVLNAAGWRLEDRREQLGGMLASERWRRCPSDRTAL